ncbi:MAG: 5-formyltetrahydrofolate cyclo-ligase [Lachnospiraceae bacterium]|nr:5-formyltetrahydrofolate cyclo-ligase [Lachnospiraceae bacterium]
MKKALIRKEMLAKRRNMTDSECGRLSTAICERFLQSDEYKRASTVLLYKAYNKEVDTDMIFKQAISDGKKVAYPLSKIINGEPELTFYFVNDLSDMKNGYMGIYEPDADRGCEPFNGCADICITPGVAFDRSGNRVGYGKAFYDRYIRRHRPGKVIGLAYELQITDEIEPGTRDIPVDIVITDKAVFGS